MVALSVSICIGDYHRSHITISSVILFYSVMMECNLYFWVYRHIDSMSCDSKNVFMVLLFFYFYFKMLFVSAQGDKKSVIYLLQVIKCNFSLFLFPQVPVAALM